MLWKNGEVCKRAWSQACVISMCVTTTRIRDHFACSASLDVSPQGALDPYEKAGEIRLHVDPSTPSGAPQQRGIYCACLQLLIQIYSDITNSPNERKGTGASKKKMHVTGEKRQL